MTENEIEHPDDTRKIHVVGIGASAGGLEALEDFFENMPESSGMAFVVVQHLSPDFKSHMEELLARKTRIPVQRVTDGVEVQADNIYLIPAKKEMVITGGRLRLTDRNLERSFAHPIDQFFRSLAADVGKLGIGVILSGTGSDGSRGIRDIHEAGGLILAQDEESAKFDGMPLNATATGVVDVTLRPEAMPEALGRYVSTNLSPQALAREELRASASGIDEVFRALRAASGVNFSHYKASTVGRRVQRRMDMLGYESVEQYSDLLRQNPEEVENLYKDLLIGVTRFFRDKEAFEFLENEILPGIIKKAESTGSIRAWVAGCASGEEAYSLAILIDEAMRRKKLSAEVKVFATDIHPGSLAAAGIGVFPEAAMSEISEERVQRYFVEKKAGYSASRELRNKIVFARHNVFQDAPFTQLDLVTCRNLLIYLQPSAQKKALALFHFGLKAGGVMFLGSSETPGDLSDEFETIESRWRIYRKRRDVRLPINNRGPVAAPTVNLPRPALTADKTVATSESISRESSQLLATYDRLLDAHMPSSILIDDEYRIVHSFGGAETFLSLRGGRHSSNLLELIDENLRTPLAGALQHAARDNAEVRYTGLNTSAQAGGTALVLAVLPLHDPRTNVYQFLVKFTENEQPLLGDEGLARAVDVDEMTRDRMKSLETELRFTRENLQATIEELETSNEELQAANEEMLASNEELQSSNEELQSVNEELFTVNSEHQKKISELTRANDDMDNLLALTRVGVIFLDEERCIRQFTPEIGRVFHLLPQDVGRSFESFEKNLSNVNLSELITNALENDAQIEERVEDSSGRAYLMRLAPYRRSEADLGIALTLIDIADIEQVREDVTIFKKMSRHAADIQLLVNGKGIITYANDSASDRLGHSQENLVGQPLHLIDPARGPSGVAHLFEEVENNPRGVFLDSALEMADGQKLPVSLSISMISLGDRSLLLIAARDVTERLHADETTKLYRSAIDATTSGIVIADAKFPDLPLIYVNPGFTRITGYLPEDAIGQNCRFLQGDARDKGAARKIRMAIEAKRSIRLSLKNQRKDGTYFWNDLTINPVLADGKEVTHFVGIQNDITKSVEDTLSAKNREAKLRTLLDSTIEGIFGLDTEGRCTFCNAAALAKLGFSDEASVIGMSPWDLVGTRESESPKLAAALQEAGTGRSVRLKKCPFFNQVKDAQFLVDLGIEPVVRSDEWIGSVITFSDITNRERQKAKLQRAKREAESANRAKTEFLANMSHEIRTPLAAIMAYGELLDQQPVADVQQEHVRAIKRNARSLLDIVNDILDLSKVEADQLEFITERVAIPELFADIRSGMEVRAREKGLDLTVNCLSPIPRFIYSDRSRLRQILLNLVGNAIKFTEVGSIAITLTHRPEIGVLQIVVSDTGIGIDPKSQEGLFEPFHQADPSIERRFGGTGLGLSITRRFVERLGGSISFESEAGKGSKFSVSVPTGKLDDDIEFVEETFADVYLPSARDVLPTVVRNVLLVDDQRDVREAAAAILRRAGANVTTMSGGEAGLELLLDKTQEFDCVLLDLQMPIKSGFETLREARKGGFEGRVIAFTAQAMKGDRERCLDAGFDDYVSKPIDSRQLLEAVERTGRSPFKILIVEDHEDSAVALSCLLAKPGRHVRIARTGQEAIDSVDESSPHLLLVDLGLPDFDGTELARRLRERADLKNSYIVALSGKSPTTRTADRFADFDGSFLKPVAIEQVEDLIESLRRSRSIES